MRSRSLSLLLVLALGVGCVVLATRIFEHYETGGWGRLEVGREHTTVLTSATRERLTRLDGDLRLTYFVSPRAEMPSSMRDVERSVTDLLDALEAAAPTRIAYQIVDPGEHDDLGQFTSRRRVAPFRIRTVERDAYSERTVFSTLTLSYGARPEVSIHGIGPDHLPRLQALLVEHLDRLERPPVLRLALAAPAGFDEFDDLLSERGSVLRVDLDGGDAVPEDVDVLFWLQPDEVPSETLAELDRFLAAGKSLIVAGAQHGLGPAALQRDATGDVGLLLDPRSGAEGTLLAHLGLAQESGLLVDERGDQILFEGTELTAPFLVRCIAPNQDFQRWREQPNGTLLFLAPSPLILTPGKLAQRRFTPHVLATSSDASRLGPAPYETPQSLAALAEDFGRATPKQPLIVALENDDPWHGEVVALAAATPFENGALHRAGTAHVRLVDTLLAELASPERLVASQAALPKAEPLPRLSRSARLAWRTAAVFLVPALLVLFALRAGLRGRWRLPRLPRWVPLGALALLGVLAAAALARRADVELDLTAGGLHELPRAAIDALARELGEREVRATLHVSSHAALPPDWRPAVRRLRERLDRFQDAGLLLGWRETHPDEEDDATRALLAADGVEPIDVTTEDEAQTSVRSVFATLVLEADGARQVLPFRELRGFDEPDFRLAVGLTALARGRRVRVAFASDAPRLSAAEAYENFQQQGLFAPLGADVYSLARTALSDLGFEVVHVNPRAPELPTEIDVLVWMQPRRTVTPMLREFVRHLVGGGRALLAAQHFVIQARQYRGTGFEHVYWPQPQSNDLEHLYLPEIGIRLEREVLFDERSTRIQNDSRVTGRTGGRDVEVQDSALPFLIRTSSANGDANSPITARLGDQAFLWANAIEWDEARLAALGLQATPLITTSARSWSYAWKGGYLPPALLVGPDPAGAYRGKRPVAARFDGTFPTPERSLSIDALGEQLPFEPGPDWPASAPGSLVLVGCSQLFRNERFHDAEFRSRDLLVNTVGALAFEGPLADLAGRRPVAPGFDYVPPRTRLVWRAAVLGAPPLAFGVLGLLLVLIRRRAVVRRPGERA